MDGALAHWLAESRGAIEREAARAAGALDPASPEAEALRRFRSFALLALARGDAAPSLEGLRVSPRRAARAVDAWIEAAAALAGPDAAPVRSKLTALRTQFVAALGATGSARAAAAAPTPSPRRAVPSAIDRISDAFLAADVDTGAIVDANPAACALLGLSRPELLARSLKELVAAPDLPYAELLLEAAAEAGDPQRARLSLREASGSPIPLDIRATPLTTRGRTLALLLCRS